MRKIETREYRDLASALKKAQEAVEAARWKLNAMKYEDAISDISTAKVILANVFIVIDRATKEKP